MKCAYKRQMVRDAYSTAAFDLVRACDCVCGEYLISIGFGGTRLQRFYDEHWDKLNSMLDFYVADGEEKFDTTTSVAFAIRRHLKEIGVDADAIENAYTLDGWQRSRSTEAKHDSRMKVVSMIKPVADAYMLCAVEYFRDRYGYGKNRITEMYDRLRAGYARFVRSYTRCDLNGDMECRRTMEDLTAAIQSKGIDLITEIKRV